jgi:hypothetical protein
MTELVAERYTYVVIISERMNMSIEVNEALEAIKAQVEDKFADVAVKADVDASIEAKADKAEISELKGALETL